jgi:hypothetical protein
MHNVTAKLPAWIVAAAAALALAGAVPSTAGAASNLMRGFADDVWFDGVGPAWVPKTVATGAKQALLEIDWASVEPTAPPPGVDPTNPAGPEYGMGYIDDVLRTLANSGVQPVFLVTDAPRWAEAPGGPADLEALGAWEPNATAFGQLATALATRYSGSYPDPQRPGRTLPRVQYYQAWAEANLDAHLAPQWTLSGGQVVPASPGIYRNLLNAFYAGIKRVRSDDVVITTGTAPYGDPQPPPSNPTGGYRMHPVEFVRELLCLHGSRLSREPCPNPAHFDVLAHDPYEVAAPTQSAFSPDDASAPDIGRLSRVLKRAVRLGFALPRGHKQVWVTEFGYESNPPNPNAVSLATQAHWLEQAFYLFWKQGVSNVFWYLIRDQAGNPNLVYFSGVYFRQGKPKPAFEAYRFPFVVVASGGHSTVWGIAPRTGKLSVQIRGGRGWQTVFHIHATAGQVFTRSISGRLRGDFRAVVGGERSLVWTR